MPEGQKTEAKDPLMVRTREELRYWLTEHHSAEKAAWIVLTRGKPSQGEITYLDIVEEALCFGWIDSTRWGKLYGNRNDDERLLE